MISACKSDKSMGKCCPIYGTCHHNCEQKDEWHSCENNSFCECFHYPINRTTDRKNHSNQKKHGNGNPARILNPHKKSNYMRGSGNNARKSKSDKCGKNEPDRDEFPQMSNSNEYAFSFYERISFNFHVDKILKRNSNNRRPSNTKPMVRCKIWPKNDFPGSKS